MYVFVLKDAMSDDEACSHEDHLESETRADGEMRYVCA